MTEKELMDFPDSASVKRILEKLNLTDRQREIFHLRYERGWYTADIAAEVGYCRKIISEELSIIRRKMAVIKLEEE